MATSLSPAWVFLIGEVIPRPRAHGRIGDRTNTVAAPVVDEVTGVEGSPVPDKEVETTVQDKPAPAVVGATVALDVVFSARRPNAGTAVVGAVVVEDVAAADK